MTREEAKKRINCVKEVVKNDFEEYEDEIVRADFMYKLIDEIFDEFESRVCKNCKHFKSKSGLCGLWENGVMNEASFFNVDEDFGCNRFERREDED